MNVNGFGLGLGREWVTPEIYSTIAIALANRRVMGCTVLRNAFKFIIGPTTVTTMQEMAHTIIHAITIVE